MGARRSMVAGLVLLTCVGGSASAVAAPAADGGHLPGFSLMNRRVAVSKLPFGMQSAFQLEPGRASIHGPLWFGEVERPSGTIYAAGVPRLVCDFEEKRGANGGGGGCEPLADARKFGLFRAESCGPGRPTRFRVAGLVPDGTTKLEVERADGTVVGADPVLDNTVAFTVGRENFTLRGIRDGVVEGLEEQLPLATVHSREGHGCTTYSFPQAPATRH